MAAAWLGLAGAGFTIGVRLPVDPRVDLFRFRLGIPAEEFVPPELVRLLILTPIPCVVSCLCK